MHRSRERGQNRHGGRLRRRTNLLRGFDYGCRGHRLDRWRALITFSQMLYHDGRGGLDRRKLRRELALRIGFQAGQGGVRGCGLCVGSGFLPYRRLLAPSAARDAPPRAAPRTLTPSLARPKHLRPRRPCQRLRRRAAAAPPEFRARRRPARKGARAFRLRSPRTDRPEWVSRQRQRQRSRDWPRIRRKTRCARWSLADRLAPARLAQRPAPDLGRAAIVD